MEISTTFLDLWEITFGMPITPPRMRIASKWGNGEIVVGMPTLQKVILVVQESILGWGKHSKRIIIDIPSLKLNSHFTPENGWLKVEQRHFPSGAARPSFRSYWSVTFQVAHFISEKSPEQCSHGFQIQRYKKDLHVLRKTPWNMQKQVFLLYIQLIWEVGHMDGTCWGS